MKLSFFTSMNVPNPFVRKKFKPIRQKAKNLLNEFKLQDSLFSNYYVEDFQGGSDAFEHIYSPQHSIEKKLAQYVSSVTLELDSLISAIDEGSKKRIKNSVDILTKKICLPRVSDFSNDSFNIWQGVFFRLARTYENGSLEIVQNPIKDSILENIISMKDQFTDKARSHEYSQIGESVKDDFCEFATHIKQIYDFEFEQKMGEYVALLKEARELLPNKMFSVDSEIFRSVPSVSHFIPENKKLDEDTVNDKQKEIALKKQIAKQHNWSNVGELIANHYKEMLTLTSHPVLTLKATMTGLNIADKKRMKKVQLDDLVGYEDQKTELVSNVEKLMSGEETNNVFVYGVPGTGKSSIINALSSEYYEKGLIIIDVAKRYITSLEQLFPQIHSIRDHKFIFHVDDFSIGKDKELYEELKVMLEGSFEGVPDNSLFWITSNYEDAVSSLGFSSKKQKTSDYNALQDRFGVVAKYDFPTLDEKQQILTHYLQKKYPEQKDISLNDFMDKLAVYCNNINIEKPNPRNIKNFVNRLSKDYFVQKIDKDN